MLLNRIKGDEFSVARLLYDKDEKNPPPEYAIDFGGGASLAIFRLAPADYHRFHSPVDGTIVGEPKDING